MNTGYGPGIVGGMTSAEARRRDVYSGLTEGIGEEQVDTLMAYLPTSESADFATATQVDAIETKLDAVEAKLTDAIGRLEIRLDALNGRLDRIVLAIIAALVIVIARSFF